MSYPYCYQGPTCQLEPFITVKSKKQPVLVCSIGNIRASAHPMAVLSGFYESHGPLLWGDHARGIVLVHCHGHQNGQQSGHILHRCFVCCHPCSRWGNTERVVAQWRHLVAFMKALNLLHRAMCAV